MGHDQTTVIDAQTAPAEATTPPAVRRKRPAVVAAGAAGVIAVVVGAVVWSTSGGSDTSTGSRTTETARSSAPAAVSDAAPSESAAPAPAGENDPGSSTVAAPSAAKASTPAAPAPAAPGWEPRTFQGVTFAVPPGATAPDLQDPGNADAPATFAWTGPSIGDGVNAQITVRFYPADQAPAPAPEYPSITVRGADQAHARTGTISEPAMTAVDVQVLAGSRFISIVGMFAAGPEGEQMVRSLLASLSVG